MLERMRDLMHRIPMMRFNLEKARCRAAKCTQVLSDMPKGGEGQDMYDKVHRIMECEEKLKSLIEELAKDRKTLEPLIQSLENPKQRAIAWLRYIDGDNVFTIAMEIGMSERQVFRIVKAAEEKIEEMLKNTQNVIDVSQSCVV